jgi:hypothetical protein
LGLEIGVLVEDGEKVRLDDAAVIEGTCDKEEADESVIF